MILLALDTCDSRGSIALRRDDDVLETLTHDGPSDYSSWLLPAADEVLRAAELSLKDVDVFAAAAGPGSFTGVRIGLTTVKAWSEAYGKPIASVSRLEAIASQSSAGADYVAAFFDAQRGQVFGGLYQQLRGSLSRVDQEMVVPPEGFVQWIEGVIAGSRVSWVSLDPSIITSLPAWTPRSAKGDSMQQASPILAPIIAHLGRTRALSGDLTDALHLDAEYVRRSDAEIFWKGSTPGRPQDSTKDTPKQGTTRGA